MSPFWPMLLFSSIVVPQKLWFSYFGGPDIKIVPCCKLSLYESAILHESCAYVSPINNVQQRPIEKSK